MTLPSGAVRFRSPGCLRGLKWVYRLPPLANWEALEAALQRAHGGRLVQATEQWGRRTVHRYVLQFEAEFRFGERDGELTVLHRSVSPPARRRAHHEMIERLIAEGLG